MMKINEVWATILVFLAGIGVVTILVNVMDLFLDVRDHNRAIPRLEQRIEELEQGK